MDEKKTPSIGPNVANAAWMNENDKSMYKKLARILTLIFLLAAIVVLVDDTPPPVDEEQVALTKQEMEDLETNLPWMLWHDETMIRISKVRRVGMDMETRNHKSLNDMRTVINGALKDSKSYTVAPNLQADKDLFEYHLAQFEDTLSSLDRDWSEVDNKARNDPNWEANQANQYQRDRTYQDIHYVVLDEEFESLYLMDHAYIR